MAETRILVVEDESIVAEHIQRCLKNLGYEVTSVVNTGENAIKELEENCPDLVLMDIVLKSKMDGIETAKQIRSRFNIPVVYLTAYSDEEILERAKITEPFGYVIKPFNERDLRINIEIALYKHKVERELKESKHWLTATLNSLGEAVIATDRNGIIKIINPYAEVLTGWKRNEATGKSLADVFKVISEGKNNQLEDPVAKAIRQESYYGLADHTILVSREGARIPIDIIGTAIKDDRDGIMGVVLVFYDIIERMRIDETLKSESG